MSAQVEVCDACLRACCWHGYFLCDESRSAGTVMKSPDELKRLGLEHPSYWEPIEARAEQLRP